MCSAASAILTSIDTMLVSIVTILASIEQVNTPLDHIKMKTKGKLSAPLQNVVIEFSKNDISQ